MFCENELECKNIESIIIYYRLMYISIQAHRNLFDMMNILHIEPCLIEVLFNIMKFEGLTISYYRSHQNEQNNFFILPFL